MANPHPPSWRTLLQTIIKDPGEKERIATELRVNPITLIRWSTGESKPRLKHLQRLLRVVPSNRRQQFIALVQQEVPGFEVESVPVGPGLRITDYRSLDTRTVLQPRADLLASHALI
jgi:hypothetical protein